MYFLSLFFSFKFTCMRDMRLLLRKAQWRPTTTHHTITAKTTQNEQKVDQDEVAKVPTEYEENDQSERGEGRQNAGRRHAVITDAERRGNRYKGNPRCEVPTTKPHPEGEDAKIHKGKDGSVEPMR